LKEQHFFCFFGTMKICFATNNPQKIAEVSEMLQHTNIEIVGLKEIGCLEELPETSQTLEGNSKQKAEYVFQNYRVVCFADDTGLEVETLNGEPGVDSAHYSGNRNSDENMNLLLQRLAGTMHRKAQFRTIIALAGLEETQIFEGIVEGSITNEKQGSGGFGYDPVFRPKGYHQTFGELSRQEKSKISHRGKAIEKLIKYLQLL